MDLGHVLVHCFSLLIGSVRLVKQRNSLFSWWKKIIDYRMRYIDFSFF